MKVALYSRVSKVDQHPDRQRKGLIKYAESMGWDYDYFEEKQSTRKTRPIKENLYKRLCKKEYDAVIVWKLFRWARTLQEAIREINILVFEKNVKFISVTDNIDLSTATGRLYFHILCAFGEFERDLLSERTKEGLAASKNKPGRPKGSKDKKKRRKAGYYQRWAGKKTGSVN
ncbi:MAG: recombinase family protein [Candidatus Aenigmatarchaeota archaeon]